MTTQQLKIKDATSSGRRDHLEEKVVQLVTSLRRRDSGASVSILDAVYWMKGCSSLGGLRYAVLLGIGKPKHYRRGGLCLIDIKEAVRAAAQYYRGSQMPENNAEHVVEGGKKLSPFLGQGMIGEKFLRRRVVLRELFPQDFKLEMDQLTRDDAIAAAHFLTSVVGWGPCGANRFERSKEMAR